MRFNRWLIILYLWVIAGSAWAQPGKPSIHHFVTIGEISAVGSIPEGTITLSTPSAFYLGDDSLIVKNVLNENAQCKDGSIEIMSYGKARFLKDTLIISIFRWNDSIVNELEIKLWKGEFLTQYFIHQRNGYPNVKVLATDQLLVLEKNQFDQGEYITGFVNFRGSQLAQKAIGHPWNAKKDWVESKYVVRGPFRILIE